MASKDASKLLLYELWITSYMTYLMDILVRSREVFIRRTLKLMSDV